VLGSPSASTRAHTHAHMHTHTHGRVHSSTHMHMPACLDTSAQVQSASMSTKLRNRRRVETQLGSFLGSLVVGEELITAICDGQVRTGGHSSSGGGSGVCLRAPEFTHTHTLQPLLSQLLAALPIMQVSEEYMEALLQLDRKLAFIASDDTARNSAAARELEGVLEKLRVRAVTKVWAVWSCHAYSSGSHDDSTRRSGGPLPTIAPATSLQPTSHTHGCHIFIN
jgi:Vps52 / Sac2 family